MIHAIRLAYDDRIATGRFPGYVIHLEMDPAELDVNVHPAKSEVRFLETRNVHDFIYSALSKALSAPVISGLNQPAELDGGESTTMSGIAEVKSFYNTNLIQGSNKQTELLYQRNTG